MATITLADVVKLSGLPEQAVRNAMKTIEQGGSGLSLTQQYEHYADLAEVKRLREENLGLQTALAAKSSMRLRVSVKGAVSIYGMGRFPITLYREQLERMLDGAEEIRQFINSNSDVLATKQPKPATPQPAPQAPQPAPQAPPAANTVVPISGAA